MKFILGKKLEMSQVFDKNRAIPVTFVSAGPCFVTQIKEKSKDGYDSVQLGFEKLPDRKEKKSLKGKQFAHFKEFRLDKPGKSGNFPLSIGDKIETSIFKKGDKVYVSAISKGKGFQGGVKKWGFSGRNATHGVKHEHRTIGSVGASGPQRVFKGKKMPGRMGAERVTVKNLEIIDIDEENNIIAIKGAIPGKRGSLVEVVSWDSDWPQKEIENSNQENLSNERKEEEKNKDSSKKSGEETAKEQKNESKKDSESENELPEEIKK